MRLSRLCSVLSMEGGIDSVILLGFLFDRYVCTISLCVLFMFSAMLLLVILLCVLVRCFVYCSLFW